jgi:hypothetical protein
LLLGEYQFALFFGLTVGGLWIISSLVPALGLVEITLMMAQLLWLSQIILAVQAARTRQRIAAGEPNAPHQIGAYRVPLQSLTRSEKALHLSREILRSELAPREHLIKSVLGKVPVKIWSMWSGALGFFNAPFYCVGMTHIHLILVEMSYLMQPVNVTRIPLGDIKQARLTGRNERYLEVEWGEDDCLRIEVLRWYRHEARAIAATFG